jgi:hypothetical protein
MAQQQLQKTYPCLTCKADIKLARKDDNSGWNKFNLDGTPHIHQKQQQQASTDLAKEVAAIKAQLQVAIMKIESAEKQQLQR